MNSKVCSKCKNLKLLYCFYKNKANCDGYDYYCKICRQPWNKYSKTNASSTWKATLKRVYNLTVEEWNEMFEQQQGRCAICGIHQSDLPRRLDVDHSHSQGNVRALVCNNCNLLIGFVETHLDLIPTVLQYLDNDNENE